MSNVFDLTSAEPEKLLIREEETQEIEIILAQKSHADGLGKLIAGLRWVRYNSRKGRTTDGRHWP